MTSGENPDSSVADPAARPGMCRRRLLRSLLVIATLPILLCAGSGWWWLSRPDFGDTVRGVGGRFRSETVDSGATVLFSLLSGREPTVYHWIDLEGSEVNDEWLHTHREEIASLSNLVLFLQSTPVTGEGLSALHGMPDLIAIDLSGVPLADADLDHVTTLPRMTQLYIAGTGISDASLARLSQTSVAHVSIDSTQATPQGIAGLAACPRLGSLELVGATDESVREVARLNGMVGLMLEGDQITTAGLAPLKQMQGLQVLTFYDSQLSEDDLFDLRQALPGCAVQLIDSEMLELRSDASWE